MFCLFRTLQLWVSSSFQANSISISSSSCSFNSQGRNSLNSKPTLHYTTLSIEMIPQVICNPITNINININIDIRSFIYLNHPSILIPPTIREVLHYSHQISLPSPLKLSHSTDSRRGGGLL